MKEILRVDKVSKAFPAFKLDQASISIKENCITGFLGKNGAGKTTLIKLILGLLNKDEGQIVYFNDPSMEMRDVKERIGVVLDEGYFYERLSLDQMKDLVAVSFKNWDEKSYRSYLKRFNLDAKQTIDSLSKGMKMKYSLSLALSHGADLLIMDEPTSGLDPEVRRELLLILRDYVQEEGKAVFFSSHIISDLEQVADEVIIIKQGRIIEQENKDELVESYRLLRGSLDVLDSLDQKDLTLVDKTSYGFSALTKNHRKIREKYPQVLIEKASLEDIFLAKMEE